MFNFFNFWRKTPSEIVPEPVSAAPVHESDRETMANFVYRRMKRGMVPIFDGIELSAEEAVDVLTTSWPYIDNSLTWEINFNRAYNLRDFWVPSSRIERMAEHEAWKERNRREDEQR